MGVIGIVQARMASTRLPGKVMKRIAGKPLLAWQFERLARCRKVDRFVVATTDQDDCLPVVDWCLQNNIGFTRGSESDVLNRYAKAVREFDAGTVVRLTSDCPIIDPEIIDTTVTHYLSHRELLDYVAASGVPRGYQVEVVSGENICIADKNASKKYQREHVMPYFYDGESRFRAGFCLFPWEKDNFRLTVDTREDLALIDKVVTILYPQNSCFTYQDVRGLLLSHPELPRINAGIVQKSLEQQIGEENRGAMCPQ